MDPAHNVLASLLKVISTAANGAHDGLDGLLTPLVERVDPRLAARHIHISRK